MNDVSSTKLISILSVFTRSEWRSFKSFINSGIDGSIGKSVELYDLLADFYPSFDHPDLNKQSLFESLFGNQEYEDKKIRYAMTDLFRLACSFLKFKEIELNPQEGQYLLASTLAKRGADKAFLSVYKNEELAASRDAEFYFHRYRDSYTYLNHYLPRQKRDVATPIAEIARNLDIFFIARKLQLLCEIVNVRNVLSVEYDFILQDQIVSAVRQGAFAEVPVIAIYFRILMSLTEPDQVNHFQELKNLLSINGDLFRKEELRDMYQYLMNYCIKKINQGETEYVKQLFEVYKTILQNKVMFTGDHLSQWDYKNIVVIGIRSGESDWVLEFINEYKQFLLPAERENAFIYNMSYYYFSIGNHHQSLALLRKVEFTDLYYQLDMRVILLKCYFEMDDEETFFYHTAAFRIFLSRNKLISDYQRTIYRNLIKFSVRLMKSDGRKSSLEELLKEIDEVKQIADINWLKKMVQQELNFK